MTSYKFTTTLLLATLAVFCTVSHAASARLLKADAKSKTLWDFIQSRDDLTVLAQLLQGSGLTGRVNNTRADVTMFLPIDAAFDNFFQEFNSSAEELLEYNATLQSILLYHLYAGMLKESDLEPRMVLNMSNAGNLTVRAFWDDEITLRDSAGRMGQILEANLRPGPRAMGHTIDRVLFPFRPSSVDEALAYNVEFSNFRDAMRAANYTALLNSSNANVTLLVPTNAAFDAALASMDLTFDEMMANSTLLGNIVSSHILSTVQPWARLQQDTGSRYFNTLNTCATIYTTQDEDSGDVVVNGVGIVAGDSAAIVEGDLVAGGFALIHVLDDVLMPMTKWGRFCRYLAQTMPVQAMAAPRS